MAEMNKRAIMGWSLYDWANSAFATSVMAAFFPIFFRKYWNGEGVASEDITFRLGLISSVASIVIVVLAPLLGSIADRTTAKKKFLLTFASVGILMTGGLFFVGQGNWLLAGVVYLFASIGFMGSNSFYDSLLPSVAPAEKTDLVSGLGFGVGYLGGGVLLVLHSLFIAKREMFGIEDVSTAVRLAILSVAFWWAIFSIPLFLFVKEPEGETSPASGNVLVQGFKDIATTFKHLKSLKHTAIFLVAYWFYIDGVDTVIRMAVDYGASIEGIKTEDLTTALILTQFVGFPAAIIFGKLGEKLGTKPGIYIGIAAYIGICSYGYTVDTRADFYTIAVMVGLVQGGIQSLSRSMYAKLIPPQKAAEFFGFYNMLGKFAAILGPILMGTVAKVTGSSRYGILSLIILFVIGGVLFYFVDDKEGRRCALSFDKAH